MFQIASKANLPIILPSWIEYVWNAVTTTDRIFAATEYDLVMLVWTVQPSITILTIIFSDVRSLNITVVSSKVLLYV